MVIGQLARRLNLPLRCSGNFTTSKLPDAQAMNEGTMSMLAAVHCGANFILHSAGFLDGLLSMSYEKFVHGRRSLRRAALPISTGSRSTTTSWPLDAFAEVGPGNHFFGCAHTMANYETAFWDSEIADNEPFEKWEAAGSTDAATRANRLWKKTAAPNTRRRRSTRHRRGAEGFRDAEEGGDAGCLVLSRPTPTFSRRSDCAATRFRNRIVFGAHTANMSDMGLPGPRFGAYLLERALGGAGDDRGRTDARAPHRRPDPRQLPPRHRRGHSAFPQGDRTGEGGGRRHPTTALPHRRARRFRPQLRAALGTVGWSELP